MRLATPILLLSAPVALADRYVAFAYMAFHDAFLHARAGHSSLKHPVAGAVATPVAVLSLAAIVQTGAVA